MEKAEKEKKILFRMRTINSEDVLGLEKGLNGCEIVEEEIFRRYSSRTYERERPTRPTVLFPFPYALTSGLLGRP